MITKKTIFLEDEDIDIIERFSYLVYSICLHSENQKCKPDCIYHSICANMGCNRLQDFCHSWDNIDDIEVTIKD